VGLVVLVERKGLRHELAFQDKEPRQFALLSSSLKLPRPFAPMAAETGNS
jgi:hypothetical protein